MRRPRTRAACVVAALAASLLLGTVASCGDPTPASVTAPTSATSVAVSTTARVTSTAASTSTTSTTAAPRTTVFPYPVSTTVSSPTTVPLAPLIVLDPGHSGTKLTTIDPATQIRDEEYRNTPETQNMFEVAMLLQAKLEAAGYRVYVTKQTWDQTICKRDRVNYANENHAALGVSIHTSGHSFGNYGEIYVQRMDSYRENIHGEKVYFALPDVAALSAQYGEIFLEERRKIEGPSIRIKVNTGWGGRGLAPGNLPIVQLFAEVPWLLVEAGVPRKEGDKDGYAQSLFNSIVRCVPFAAPSPAPLH